MADEDTGTDTPAPEGEESTTETETDERDEKIASLEAQLSKFQKRDDDRAKSDKDSKAAARRKAHESATKAGEHNKLLGMAHEDRDEARTERDEARSALGVLQGKERSRKLARAVVAKAGGGNVDAIAALAPSLGLTLEDNPGKELVAAAHKELNALAPSLLGAPTQHPNGRPPLRPGVTVPVGEQSIADINSPEYWKNQGRLASEQSRMPPGYEEATGRTPRQ